MFYSRSRRSSSRSTIGGIGGCIVFWIGGEGGCGGVTIIWLGFVCILVGFMGGGGVMIVPELVVIGRLRVLGRT